MHTVEILYMLHHTLPVGYLVFDTMVDDADVDEASQLERLLENLAIGTARQSQTGSLVDSLLLYPWRKR